MQTRTFYLCLYVDEDLFRLFPKKKVSDGGQTRTDGKSVSKLSFLVKNCHNQPWNPFENYSKFDGEVTIHICTCWWQRFNNVSTRQLLKHELNCRFTQEQIKYGCLKFSFHWYEQIICSELSYKPLKGSSFRNKLCRYSHRHQKMKSSHQKWTSILLVTMHKNAFQSCMLVFKSFFVVENACVQDLIGLIMFKYTEKKRVPELKVFLVFMRLSKERITKCLKALHPKFFDLFTIGSI